MNVIGKFGNFMMNHQVGIEIALVVIFILAIGFLLVRVVIHAGKKRQLLSQIQDTVTEINTAVQNLSEKKEGVIYIDNRTTDKDAETKVFEAGRTSAEEILQRVHENAAPSFAGEEEISSVNSAKMEESELPRKYFSRDCCTSKMGKTYTIEELEEQIRE